MNRKVITSLDMIDLNQATKKRSIFFLDRNVGTISGQIAGRPNLRIKIRCQDRYVFMGRRLCIAISGYLGRIKGRQETLL